MSVESLMQKYARTRSLSNAREEKEIEKRAIPLSLSFSSRREAEEMRLPRLAVLGDNKKKFKDGHNLI